MVRQIARPVPKYVYLFRGLTVRQYVHAAVLMHKSQSAESLMLAITDCKCTVIFRTVHARVDYGKLIDTVTANRLSHLKVPKYQSCPASFLSSLCM